MYIILHFIAFLTNHLELYFVGLPELLRNAMQSSKVITQLRTCPNCHQLYGNTATDTPTTDCEPTMTTEDEPSTTNTLAIVATMPAISTIASSEARSSYTSPLNTPSEIIQNISMVGSPSIVSVHSCAGSSPSTQILNFQWHYPPMQTTSYQTHPLLKMWKFTAC